MVYGMILDKLDARHHPSPNMLNGIRVTHAPWHPALRFLLQSSLSEAASISLLLDRTLFFTSMLGTALDPMFHTIHRSEAAMSVSYASRQRFGTHR